MFSENTQERFLSKVTKTETCWIWTGGSTSFGYGKFAVKTGCSQNKGWTMKWAHRISFEMFRCPIPPNKELDHICRNRACVNPDHLEPVEKKTNLLRGISGPAINARKTHCIRGHEFTIENTRIIKNGRGRGCRTCSRDSLKRNRIRWGKPSKNFEK